MPLVPSPPTECKNAVCREAGQVAKGTGFTFPTGTMVCVAFPCPSWPGSPQTGPKGSDQGAASLQKRRTLSPLLLLQA